MIEELLINNFPIGILILVIVIYNERLLKKNNEILVEIKNFIRRE